MLQQEEPIDLVIATGEVHSVREFVEKAFNHVGKTIVWEHANTHTHTPQIKPIWLIWHIWCWFDHRLYKTAQQHANTP